MYEVSKCAPQEALRDLERAYSDMIRRIKNHNKKIGKPKFKKKGIHDSFKIINNNFRQKTQLIKIKDTSIKLPKLGFIRTKESTYKLRGRILNAAVSREADRWYCSLCVEVERP